MRCSAAPSITFQVFNPIYTLRILKRIFSKNRRADGISRISRQDMCNFTLNSHRNSITEYHFQRASLYGASSSCSSPLPSVCPVRPFVTIGLERRRASDSVRVRCAQTTKLLCLHRFDRRHCTVDMGYHVKEDKCRFNNLGQIQANKSIRKELGLGLKKLN